MESAPKEDSSGTSRADKAEALMGVDGKKKGPSNALMFGEELQFWCGKVQVLARCGLYRRVNLRPKTHKLKTLPS